MKTIFTSIMICLTSVYGWAQSSADSSAIIQTARDYVEGWAEGNADRVGKAVSPELAKRKVYIEDEGNWFISDMSASLLCKAASGNKDGVRIADREPNQPFRLFVKILDISGNVASVKAWNTKYGFLDYCHMAKIGDEWKIINVLWDYLPAGEQ